jgi:hypothetical protein
MSADPIVYCLEHLTDFSQFERLCSDILSGTDYPSIEPIGGTGDRGRDALHYCNENSTKTVFAYTVRADWKNKLHQDCSRISEEQHNPDQVVFVCTSTLSGTQRDLQKQWALEKYGWGIEFYDLERLRVLLAGNLRHLLAHHPAIFCPPWFPTRGGISIAESADTIIVDHVEADHAFAVWLARRLSLAGYRNWCYGIAPLAGEDGDESARKVIESRGIQYLPVLSVPALADQNFMARVAIASSRDNFVLPCSTSSIEFGATFRKLFQTEPAKFEESWSAGLDSLTQALLNRAIRPNLIASQGKAIALRAYMPEPLTKLEPQPVYTNVFPVSIPKSILICPITRNIDALEKYELRKKWAFVAASEKVLLAFDHPPPEVPLVEAKRLQEFAWDSYPEREGLKTINVIKQLIRQSLDISCNSRGLEFCPDRQVYHFTEEGELAKSVPLTHVDGKMSRVGMTGERQWGYGERATKFKYQLGPKFRVSIDNKMNFWVTTRIYVRVTTSEGVPFEDKQIGSRRKKVTKSWWNRQWLLRTLGMMQYLRNDPDSDHIEIGSGKRKVSICIHPRSWDCPVAIDVEAVDKIGDLQEELAAISYEYFSDESDENIVVQENDG